MRSPTTLLVLAGLVVGCASDPEQDGETWRVGGLEPNTAPAPRANDEDWPEALSQVGGEADGAVWGHGLGYVHGTVPQVWQALQDPLLVADRRSTDTQDHVVHDDPVLDHGFTLFYTVERLITIAWSEDWCHGVVSGTVDAPTAAFVWYHKVDGDDVIAGIEGSITLAEVSPGVTEVGLVEHLDALGAEETMISQYFDDLFESILAGVAGEPLPTY